MSKPIISVENLGKKYIIGENIHGRGARTFRDMFDQKLRNLFQQGEGKKRDDTILWALKDVSFDVKQGEVVGIIGRNGAGKSTLLKVLSRITEPTEGQVTIRGRVASLLEVGTGFSGELTGRENIFLNGSILGMKKAEIRRKFDEIVAFSEVERFIDTPVKRYSSGMYVRLAFAVAAHLDPEILIVDEVLAVGDAQFQKKCLGKMGDAALEGRTVLFVSHNMDTVNRLCKRGIWLEQGKVFEQGNIHQITSEYLKLGVHLFGERNWDFDTAPGDEVAKLKSVRIITGDKVTSTVNAKDDFSIEIEYWNLKDGACLFANITLINEQGVYLFLSDDKNEQKWGRQPRPVGVFRAKCKVHGNLLTEGQISIVAEVSSFNPMYRTHFLVRDSAGFQVLSTDEESWRPSVPGLGVVRPKLEWENQYFSE